jgi:uncharacterized protein YjeT (DUF2065 family)
VSEVGVVSIVLGVVVLCSRGALLVAPAATLRWFEGVIETNARTRALGAVALALGTAMAWAGASEQSGLATILWVVGWASIGISTLALLLFPAAYRAIAEKVLPSDPDPDLSGWRVLGLFGVIVGGLLIYFGALAL